MLSLFEDSPEYLQRIRTPFKPTTVSTPDIHAAVPKELHKKDTFRALGYVARSVLMSWILYLFGTQIDAWLPVGVTKASSPGLYGLSSVLWLSYWFWQSIVFAGLFTLAHEAAHGTLSPHRWINDVIGFSLHTFLLVPYFAWRSSHRSHHKAVMSLERDQNFVPRTRSARGLPSEASARKIDYHDMLEETPVYSLVRLVMMQLLGMQAYLMVNAMGSPSYPRFTNHLSPFSKLFKSEERNAIVLSDIGLLAMFAVLHDWSSAIGMYFFVKLYIVPYALCHHWIVMLTYLHHTDPSIPIYRRNGWTWVRGALSTVDRPLLGWMGRFFLHNISHDHIAHHFFSSIPFYNLPEVTKRIKVVLKDDYNYDSTNSFRALYRTFRECEFVEDEGDIVFHKNKKGEAARVVAQ